MPEGKNFLPVFFYAARNLAGVSEIKIVYNKPPFFKNELDHLSLFRVFYLHKKIPAS